MSAPSLLDRWRADAATLRRYRLTLAAEQLEDRIAELERELSSHAEAPLSLRQASAESGYSTDHLARLLRQGAIPNAGRRHAPRILRRDLPRRPGASDRSGVVLAARDSYDPITDARALLSRQGER